MCLQKERKGHLEGGTTLRGDLTGRRGGDGGQRSSQSANRDDLPVLQIPGRRPKGAACTPTQQVARELPALSEPS